MSDMFVAGIDCGAGNTQAVILKDAAVIGRAGVKTGFDRVEAVETALARALEEAGVERGDLAGIGGTGAGGNAVKTADVEVSEETAMAKGARFYFPGARTVAGVGAEEARAVRLGEDGEVEDRVVNERCAAGAGLFIESMSRALGIPLEEMGPLALASDRTVPMNAQCVVFAEFEVVRLLHSNTEKRDISRAVHDAVAGRIVSMLRRLGIAGDLVMIGGVACNPGIVEAVKRDLGLDRVHVPELPEYAAALGAALAAADTVS